MGVASGGATVAAGSIGAMTSAGRIALTLVTAGSSVVNGVNVVNGLTNKTKKLLTRRKLAGYFTDIYNREKHQSQTEKSQKKMWGILKDFVTVEVLRKKCRISGIPNDHLFQEMFELLKDNEKYGFTLLNGETANELLKDNEKYGFPLLNMETANTSAQDAAQIDFDMNGIRSSPSDKMLGVVCNGMQGEEQYCEMAAELTGNTDSIYMFECGDTASINVNDGPGAIMVESWMEDSI